MSLFKRISATLTSRIDQVVGEIENHDAVIQATLSDMCKKVADAKIRLNRVKQEEANLNRQIAEQRRNREQWRRRAVESARSDEAKALECLHRGRLCQQQVERLEQVTAQYEQSAAKLAHDIESSERYLSEIRQKQTLLRARQSSSAALNATSATDEEASRLLDDTFDRWEINVTKSEVMLDSDTPPDAMEQEFNDREEQQALRRELAALLAEEEEK